MRLPLRRAYEYWILRRGESPLVSPVEEAYRLRIAELQARYRLVPFNGPVFYMCNDQSEVVATYFETDPPTLTAERGDQVSLMLLQPSGSGAKYQGRIESFWEKAGEAMVTWGYGSRELRCKENP
jgi:membrane-bound inhibitor of C-type lysozyme